MLEKLFQPEQPVTLTNPQTWPTWAWSALAALGAALFVWLLVRAGKVKP